MRSRRWLAAGSQRGPRAGRRGKGIRGDAAARGVARRRGPGSLPRPAARYPGPGSTGPGGGSAVGARGIAAKSDGIAEHGRAGDRDEHPRHLGADRHRSRHPRAARRHGRSRGCVSPAGARIRTRPEPMGERGRAAMADYDIRVILRLHEELYDEVLRAAPGRRERCPRIGELMIAMNASLLRPHRQAHLRRDRRRRCARASRAAAGAPRRSRADQARVADPLSPAAARPIRSDRSRSSSSAP